MTPRPNRTYSVDTDPREIATDLAARTDDAAEASGKPMCLYRRTSVYDWTHARGTAEETGIVLLTVTYFLKPREEVPPAEARLILEVQP